jgi:hypothetical protein
MLPPKRWLTFSRCYVPEDVVISKPHSVIMTVKSTILQWIRLVTKMGHIRYVYRILVRNRCVKLSVGRSRQRWKYRVNMDYRENGRDKSKLYSIRHEAKISFGVIFAIIQFTYFVFLSRMHLKEEYKLRVFENKVSKIIFRHNIEK